MPGLQCPALPLPVPPVPPRCPPRTARAVASSSPSPHPSFPCHKPVPPPHLLSPSLSTLSPAPSTSRTTTTYLFPPPRPRQRKRNILRNETINPIARHTSIAPDPTSSSSASPVSGEGGPESAVPNVDPPPSRFVSVHRKQARALCHPAAPLSRTTASSPAPSSSLPRRVYTPCLKCKRPFPSTPCLSSRLPSAVQGLHRPLFAAAPLSGRR